jgi:hypothetical protein
VPVRVIDKLAEPTSESRAVVVHARADHVVLAVGGAAAHHGAVVVADDEDRYGFGGRPGLIVVRPDGYIGAIAAGGETSTVDAYFSAIGDTA